MANVYNINTIKLAIIKYSPILVKDIWIFPNKSAFKLNKFLIVNWSNGLFVHKGNVICILFCYFWFSLIYILFLIDPVNNKRKPTVS